MRDNLGERSTIKESLKHFLSEKDFPRLATPYDKRAANSQPPASRHCQLAIIDQSAASL
jgi:hypothetical protein